MRTLQDVSIQDTVPPDIFFSLQCQDQLLHGEVRNSALWLSQQYIALSLSTRQLIWIDNAFYPKINDKSKHIDVIYHFLREDSRWDHYLTPYPIQTEPS